MTAEVWTTAVGVQLMLRLAQLLERQGMAMGAERVANWMEATTAMAPFTLDTLQLTGHATLCSDRDSIALFDQCYATWCQQNALQNVVPTVVPSISSVSMSTGADKSDQVPGEQRHELAVSASQDLLRHRDFSTLSADEKFQVQRMLLALEAAPSLRRTRRFQPGQRGRIDLRKTLREALRNDGEILSLRYLQRRQRPRRRVLLIDVSGSMAPYADTLLLFGYALMRSAPRYTEVFTIGTRLTRLTRAWRISDPEQALTDAANAVPDWLGGTLLGEQIEVFMDRWGKRGITRGAVMMIASDGWENGDGALLGAQMARLHRMAHSVVWSNPHKSSKGYQPIARGIRSAMPHIDYFMSGCNLNELDQLVRGMQVAGNSPRHARVQSIQSGI